MILLLDNYDSFTYNIYQYLCELTDEEVRVIRNDKTTPKQIEALAPSRILLSPGPGRPEDAGCMIQVLKHFAGKVPILGVCLGHQAIGYAFGGKIIGAKAIIHGKTQPIAHDGRGIFRGLNSPTVFTRYHSLVIDRETLPQDLEVTATSPDGEIMGVRHKTYPIEGVQFHPESIASEGGKILLRNFLNYKREPFGFKATLTQILDHKDLTQAQAADFMEELTDGTLGVARTAAILAALNGKGIRAPEIAGCAQVLQRKRTPLPLTGDFLDIVGTGGDEIGSFNISSMAALIAASCGARVAKHGNRAVSSLCGSADFYQALGIKIDITPDQAAKTLEQTGFMFLFAPVYHGAMKHAAPVRKELGIKTIMNLLGPLVNPAQASSQLIGVYSDELAPVMLQAAALLGVKNPMTVWGSDGQDEISVCAPTHIYRLNKDRQVEQVIFDPSTLGIPHHSLEDLKGGNAEMNAALALELLDNKGRPAIRDAVCVNAGAALWVAGLAGNIEDGYQQALFALKRGKVKEKLAQVIAATKEA